MESNISGQIQYEKIPSSRALRSFTYKHIQRWIQKIANSRNIPATYFVRLKREGTGHTFNCQIQVKVGNQTWVGHNYEESLHRALIQCLHQMQLLPFATT